jgi:hypothetical protein
MTTLVVSNAQQAESLKRTKYAVEVSQFVTGSGFASGTEVYFTLIRDDKKTLSFGIFFSPDFKRNSGISVHHEVALLRNPSTRVMVPYAFYNMAYRFTRATVEVPGQKEASTEGLYKSFEHHIGIGMNIKMAKNLYFKSAAGYGIYFGSIAKPTIDPLTREAIGSNGFGAIGKLGITYVF